MVATEKPGADQREREQKCSTAQTGPHGAILLLARVFGPVLTTGRRKSATRPPDITHSEKCEARWAGRNPGCTSLNGPGAACGAVSQATASSATSSSCHGSGVIHGQRSFCPSQGPERLCGPQESQGWRESDTCKYELGKPRWRERNWPWKNVLFQRHSSRPHVETKLRWIPLREMRAHRAGPTPNYPPVGIVPEQKDRSQTGEQA